MRVLVIRTNAKSGLTYSLATDGSVYLISAGADGSLISTLNAGSDRMEALAAFKSMAGI